MHTALPRKTSDYFLLVAGVGIVHGSDVDTGYLCVEKCVQPCQRVAPLIAFLVCEALND